MSKKSAELSVAFASDTEAIKVVTVVLQNKDLYTIIHRPNIPIQSKHSYHESGTTHTKTKILDRELKSSGNKGEPLGDLTGFKFVSGGGGPPPELGDYTIKTDTARRKTLVLARPGSIWGAEVWAIEHGRKELVKKIDETPPYERVAVRSLLADWTSPYILVKVWHALDDSPYEVIRYDPPIPGRIPYILDPPHYKGTWLEGHFPPRPAFEQQIIEQTRREQTR